MKGTIQPLAWAALIVLAFRCQTPTAQSLDATGAQEPLPNAISTSATEEDNRLSEQEKQEGWVLLFDGTSMDQWRKAGKDAFPKKGWKIDKGILSVTASGKGGDIVTKKSYANFDLKVDFQLTEGANSGIKYFVMEDYPEPGSVIGLEYQLLDDERHPDAKEGNNGLGCRTVAALYDLIAPQNKKMKPIGEWNQAEIRVRGNQVEHWLNGQKVLSYERGSAQYNQLVEKSKYKDFENFGLIEQGPVLLQDHGDPVNFKNIKIREHTAS